MQALPTDALLRLDQRGDLVSVLWKTADAVHTQSTLHATQPERLVDPWVRLVAGGALTAHLALPPRGHALHLGVGGGVLANFTCQVLGMRTTGIELSPTMADLATTRFGLCSDVDLHIADGTTWVAQPEQAGAFDLIISEMFLPGSGEPIGVTADNFRHCRNALNPAGGTLVINFGQLDLNPRAAIEAMAGVFGIDRSLLFLRQPLERYSTVIGVATTTAQVFDAARIQQRFQDIERLYAGNGLSVAELQAALLPALALRSV